jgi:MoaA/NifB/PqqE/SkfB family radical SAM enzyme
MNKKILINVELTSHCFANCSMCPREEVKDFGYITPETMETILSQIDSDLAWEINLSGRGEPTLHRHFPLILEKLHNAPAKTALVTTGVCMTPPIIEAIDKYIDKVRLSISSFDPETFSKVHRGLRYHSVWENIAMIAKTFPKKVVCHLVGGPTIYDSLPLTVNHLRSLGFSEVYLFPLWNRGGARETEQTKERRISLLNELNIPPSEKEYVNGDQSAFQADAATFSKMNPSYCPVGDSSIAIGYNGDILGCFQDFGHHAVIGNVHTNTLREIYNARKASLGRMCICSSCNTKNEALV